MNGRLLIGVSRFCGQVSALFLNIIRRPDSVAHPGYRVYRTSHARHASTVSSAHSRRQSRRSSPFCIRSRRSGDHNENCTTIVDNR